MIRIYGDWYITIETNPVNFVVRRGGGRKNDKGGYVDKARAFYATLQGALKHIRREIIAEELSGACMSLVEAIQTVSECDRKFDEQIKAVIG